MRNSMFRIISTLSLMAAFAVTVAHSQTDRGTISGKITKDKSRAPVVDAIVKFTLERSPAGFRRTTKSRPPDGKFSDEMPQGWVLVSVFKKDEDGSIWVGKDRVKVDTNYGASIPEIKLAKGEAGAAASLAPGRHPATVEGLLSDGHLPLSGFISVNEVESGDEVATASVDIDGKYSMRLPTNREYVFTAMAEGHAAKLLVVSVRSSSRLDIPLTP